jgi:membrane protease YdiL (CAAX protease family)
VGLGKIRFRKVHIKTVVCWLVPFIALNVVLSLIFTPSQSQEIGTGLSTAIRVCLFSPIFEELFFRGALMSREKSFGAVFLSGIVFGIFHGAELFVPTFLLGVYLAISYKRTNNFLIPAMLHVSNNTIAFILSLLF